jgi:ankyrin repeat protein
MSREQNDSEKVSAVFKAVERKRAKKLMQTHYTMCLAAGKGDLKTLRVGVESNIDLETCNYFGRTPLHVAASDGDLEAVSYLLPLMENLNQVDKRGNTPLMDAVRHSHVDVAKLMKSVGCILNEDFASIELSGACADDDHVKVGMLLALGVNPSLNPPGRRKGQSRRRRSAAHMAASRNSVASSTCMRAKRA